MPGRDGTGPVGAGAGTGRGMGGCVGAPANGQNPVYGIGRQHRAGCRGMNSRGFGRGFAGMNPSTAQKAALEQQREALRARLDQVDEQLKNI